METNLSAVKTNLKMVLRLSLGQWNDVQGNPRQRNTEEHAKKIEPGIRENPSPQHSTVAAGQLPSGNLVKLDGHTRNLLWQENRIPVPPYLDVLVYEADDMKHAKAMYELFNNKKSVKNAADQIYGAFREHEITPKSRILKRGSLKTVLSVIEAARVGNPKSGPRWDIDVNAASREWRNEIMGLDAIIFGHESRRLHSSILAAILLTIRRRGFDTVEPFWRRYLQKEEGGSVRDPHNLLLAHLTRCQLLNQTGGSSNQMDITSKAISACENAIGGFQRTRLLGCSVLKYLHLPDSSLPGGILLEKAA